MALTKMTANVANIIALDDNPNEGATPLSSSELKNRFDKAGTDIKTYLNSTLTEELDTKFTSVDSTASTISSSIGTLSNLTTSNKSNVVSAINEVKADSNINPMNTGAVGTPVGNSKLIVKKANNTEAPNNGVVLEYGMSQQWTGQLYLGDNATQGLYWNGWSNGTRGTWKKILMDDDTGWKNLSPSYGTWEYLRYRKSGKKVRVEGHCPSYKFTGSTAKVIATLPSGYRPPKAYYLMTAASGRCLVRFVFTTSGAITMDWCVMLGDNSYRTDTAWVNFSYEFYVD